MLFRSLAMAWVKLDTDLLKTHLADSEQEALNTVAVEADNILQEECHHWAEAWRGRIKKYHVIDRREDYVPTQLLAFILIHVRYSSFTRLPGMETLLDKLRQREWEYANQVFENPDKVAIDEPEEPEEDVNEPMVVVDPRNYFLDC